MILCADIGNSTIFLGILKDGQVLDMLRLPTYQCDIETQLNRFINDVKVDLILISSVVPQKTEAFSKTICSLTGAKAILLGKDMNASFHIAIESPTTLGSDRIADAAAAIHDYSLPIIVIDLGTATTCSVIDRNGFFQGGIICPGMQTSFKALTEKAAKLKDLRLEKPNCTVGKSTQQCINSGIIIGHAAMIDGLIDRIESETHDVYSVICTGGLSTLIAPFCNHNLIVDKSLILRGLYYIYSKTVSNKNLL